MSVHSLQTFYDGIYFRSRLEARWAVFMDEAGFSWRYEPSWIETRIAGNWRPDFQLEDGRWVEVKGQLTDDEYVRLITLASAVAGHDGADVVILGHVPLRGLYWPLQLHRCEDGELWASPFTRTAACPVASGSMVIRSDRLDPGSLLSGGPFGQPKWARDALSAARQAQFR